LSRFVEDRTRMVAAIGHDLRTPLTRLRLRAEFIDDPEVQRKMLSDLDEMESMINATLAFARDDAAHEPRVATDLADLLQSLCDDRIDAGAAASYAGPPHRTVTCRPVALRRAFANLIDNAINYGTAADVTLTPGPAQVTVTIDDHGPGIPESEWEKVFHPFYRLESSRSRDTGGTGLGLAVARTIIRGHGGDITLSNRSEGGLRVSVVVPV
jgi:signal transduction histidine kinase